MPSKTIEELRQENRQRLSKNIGRIAFQRDLTTDEINKLNLMLDIGKTIPEVLTVLREKDEKAADASCAIDLADADYLCTPVEDSGANCLRTPLEMHFHRYVS